MAAKDVIHDAVKNALIKDGWTITDDPFTIKYKKVSLLIDLAAERAIAAERNGVKIAVEVKSFLNPSLLNDLKTAIGQYEIYLSYLEIIEPDRKLYIAIDEETYEALTSVEGLEVVFQKHTIPFIVVKIETEEIAQWIN
jgi:hypothetical protein